MRLFEACTIVLVTAVAACSGEGGGVCAKGRKPLDPATGPEWERKRSLLPAGGTVCGVGEPLSSSFGRPLRVDYARTLSSTFVDVVSNLDRLGLERVRQKDPSADAGTASVVVESGGRSLWIDLDERGGVTRVSIADWTPLSP